MRWPFVISIPHCSGAIPDEIRPSIALTDRDIEESVDIGTRDIFGDFPVKGVLISPWSRLVVDLNRSHDQREPTGVVAHFDYFGRAAYKENAIPDRGEVERRIKTYYMPYHKALRNALHRPDVKILFDCHSLNGIGPAQAPDPGQSRKDIVLGNNGDHYGRPHPGLGVPTCPAELLRKIKATFQDACFTVSLNDPYAGGFITTSYGATYAPAGKMAIQIEINQDLYLDPSHIRPHPDRLKEVKEKIRQSFERIAELF